MNKLYDKLLTVVAKEQITADEPLSKHTTFRIGGPCDYFINIKTEEELVKVVRLCKEEKVSYLLIGNGSNLLVADEGYRGVVLKIDDCSEEFTVQEEEQATIVTASAGMNLTTFAMKVANLGLTGFEFAAGIPGTLGGAVFMNAGAYGGEIKNCIICARVVNMDGEILTLSKEELQLSYRSSIAQQKGYLILSATFQFLKGDKDLIHQKIEELNRQRREKQPLEYPSAGSTFKRPEGYFAGKLIMDAGLKGYRVGGAVVSEKHSGFVINTGNATAADVIQLINDVSRIVKEKYDVVLEPEVRIIS